jgi:hypothetical protein
MNNLCTALSLAFQAGSEGANDPIDAPGVNTAVLTVALTTNGFPDANLDELDLGQGPGSVGYAWGTLDYVAGGWIEVNAGAYKFPAFFPARFTGQVEYVSRPVYRGANVGDANPGDLTQEPMNVTISQGPEGYSLSLRSESLSGTCALQCSAGGGLLLSGQLSGTLVSLTFGWTYVK